jgi:hypothetical protein
MEARRNREKANKPAQKPPKGPKRPLWPSDQDKWLDVVDLDDDDTFMVCAHAGISTLGLLRMGDSVTCQTASRPEFYKLQRVEHFVFLPNEEFPTHCRREALPQCSCRGARGPTTLDEECESRLPEPTGGGTQCSLFATSFADDDSLHAILSGGGAAGSW